MTVPKGEIQTGMLGLRARHILYTVPCKANHALGQGNLTLNATHVCIDVTCQ